MRAVLTAMLVCALLPLSGQELSVDTTAALSFSSRASLPMNHAQVLQQAREAWQASFGKEPGARLLQVDEASATLEGTAYIRFRSGQLVGREETMGIISYRVTVEARNGECRTHVSDLRHVGNHKAQRGGIDVGLLTNGTVPPNRIKGISYRSSVQLWNDLKDTASEEAQRLLRTFESNLRAGTTGP
jgi:hypothetical protein